VGKWAARLAEKSAAPSPHGTDRTDKRGLLAVLAGRPPWGAGEFLSKLPQASAPCDATKALDLAATAWTASEIARFLKRRTKLVRWGWAALDAEGLAERLVLRDRDQDERVNCTDCGHFQPGRCGNHTCAGLSASALSRDFASLLQRCAGFKTVPARG